MSQHMMPFGAGTRACPGRCQTQMILHMTLAALVLNFDISGDPQEVNEKTMSPIATFVSMS